MEKTGQCLCGAVQFTVSDIATGFGACHCEMCRRWTGSALLAITVPAADITFEGRENVATRQGSEWAERGWCEKCGSGIWYRLKAEGSDEAADYHIPVGLLDDADGLVLRRQIYIDRKPDGFSYAQATINKTAAEVQHLFGPAKPEAAKPEA